MKLKYIHINGYGILVHETDNIKGYENFVDISDNTFWVNELSEPMKKSLFPECFRIIFAEKELNINVPVLPYFRNFNEEQKAIFSLIINKQFVLHSIGCYEHLETKKLYNWEELVNYFNSIYENPKFIIMESDIVCSRCYSNDYDECWSAKECSRNHTEDFEKVKLFTNTHGKSEGIIKELIY